MKSTIQLDQNRTLTLMKVINKGKYVNINGFLNTIGVNPTTFRKSLDRIKKSLPLDYAKYVKENEENFAEYFENCKNLISIMEEMIENGVQQADGTIREFDVIDWHKIYSCYFEGANRELISKIIEARDKEVTGFKTRAIKTRELISKSSNNTLGSYYNQITSRHILMDKTYGLSDKEKNDIINFFDSYDIPYNYVTFDCAAKRVINGRKKEHSGYWFDNECFKTYVRVK